MANLLNITTKNIAKNTIFQLLGKLFTMAITVSLTYMITNYYGRESYGDFSLMQSLPGLLFIITDFGLNAISVREATKDESRLYHYFVNILILRIVLSLLFITFLAIVLSFFPYTEELKFGIRINLLLILTFSLFTTTNIIFQTKLRYDLSSLSQICGYVFILIASFVLIRKHYSVTIISFSYVIGGFISFFISILFINKILTSRLYFVDTKLIKSLLIESLPLGAMFVFSQISFKEDLVLLSLLKIPSWVHLNYSEVVGVYSLPYKIFEVVLVVPTFFMNSVYPFLVKYYDESSSKFLDVFKKTLLFLLFSGAVLGFMGIIFAPLLISFFGSEEFAFSIPILRILLGGVFIFFLTQPLAWFLVVLKGQKHLPKVYLISSVINLILNLIFIPMYSFYAAATITLVSEFIIFLLLGFYAVREWRLKVGVNYSANKYYA